MMSDLRAAAEATVRMNPNDSGDCLENAIYSQALARHFLANHAADDGDELDYAWVASLPGWCEWAIGKECYLPGVNIRYAACLGGSSQTERGGVYMENRSGLYWLDHITTRGQLRRLIAALGGR